MKRGLLAGAALLFALCGTAYAEVGKASASPGEWFLGLNAGAGATWAPERQAYQHAPPFGTDEVDFDDGSFFWGGLEVGYVFAEPTTLMDRVELNVDFRGMSRSLDRNPGALFWLFRDENLNATVTAGDPGIDIDGEDEQSDIEARLSFKSTLSESDGHAFIASLEPFYRHQDTDGKTTLSTPIAPVRPSRVDDIDADYYGAQIALEFETPLSESTSLVGRAAAGVYHVDADIETALKPANIVNIPIEAEDSDSSWGGRFGGALGVKIPLLYSGASLTVLATVDYMTDVATIDHAVAQTTDLTQADFDDMLDIGGRVGLVFPLR